MDTHLGKDSHLLGTLPTRVKYSPSARAYLSGLLQSSPLPDILKDAGGRLMAYVYWPTRVLPSLNTANGSWRQQRVERRDACVRLGLALLRYVDLASLRVGIPTREGFRPLTLSYLGYKAGLCPGPTRVSRKVERAWRDLRNAGVVVSSQVRRFIDGEWHTFVALKALRVEFFEALGFSKRRVKRERNTASRRLEKQARKWSQSGTDPRSLSDIARFMLILKGRAFGSSTSQHGSVGSAPSPQSPPTGPPQTWSNWNEETRRAYTLKCADLMIQDPTLSPDVVHRAALTWLQSR